MTRLAATLCCLGLLGCGSVAVRFPAPDAGTPGFDGGACGCASPLRCEDSSSRCVECLSSADCSGETPVCDPTLARCVPCAGTLGCAAGSTCEAVHRQCVTTCTELVTCTGFAAGCIESVCAACADDDACGGGRCVHETGRCVSCRSDEDCAAPTPRCEPWTGTCTACLTTSDCPAGQGCSQGRCL